MGAGLRVKVPVTEADCANYRPAVKSPGLSQRAEPFTKVKRAVIVLFTDMGRRNGEGHFPYF